MHVAYPTIAHLLLQSDKLLLKLAFWVLPASLILSIAGLLFIDILLISYESHLSRAYLGLQGRLSIESTDTELLNDIQKKAQLKHWLHSPRQDLQVAISFTGNSPSPDIVKNVKVIVLEKDYMHKKFGEYTTNQTLIMNTLLKKSFGEMDLTLFNQLKTGESLPVFSFNQIKVIDTGYLTSDPLIFMDRKTASQWLKISSDTIHKIEFMETRETQIKKIKHSVQAIAKQHQTMRLIIRDVINDSEDSRQFFKTIRLIEIPMIGFNLLLCLFIVFLSMEIALLFKRQSLAILCKIGFSQSHMTTITVMMITLIYFISVGLGLILLWVLEYFFTLSISLPETFFQPMNMNHYSSLLIVGVLLIITSMMVIHKFSNTKHN